MVRVNQEHSVTSIDEKYEDLRETIGAMKSLERACYSCTNYLSSKGTLNRRWREKICEWYFKMVDHFEFSREVVSVSVSLLDRYLSIQQDATMSTDDCDSRKSGDATDPAIAQLAAISALHLAVKLNERRKIKMSSLADLSRGQFTTEMLGRMEMSILATLKWHVNPITPLQFMNQFMNLIDIQDPIVRHNMFEMARFLSELSVCDHFFLTVPSSVVAYACLAVALEFSFSDSLKPAANVLQQLASRTSYVAGMSSDDADVRSAVDRVRLIYVQSAAFPKQTVELKSQYKVGVSSVEHSPTSIMK